MRTATRLLAAPLVLLSLQLTGCTEDAGGETSGEQSQDSQETPRAPEDPTSEEPRADGPEVDLPAYSFNLPDGWRVVEDGVTFTENDVNASGPFSPDGGRSLHFGADVDSYSGDVEEAADYFLESVRGQSSNKVRRVDDVEIDGEPALHVTGPGGSGTERFHGFLVIHDDLLLDMVLRTPGTPAESQELVDSMFATWEWK